MEFILSVAKHMVVNHISKNTIFSTLQYYLVYHPKILNFSWNQGQTHASSPLFITLAPFSYLFLTFLLQKLNLPKITRGKLKSFKIIHNAILLILSTVMALGCTLSVINFIPNTNYYFCFPKNTPPKGPLFFWSYIFYLSKILEYLDTLLIILSKSTTQLTFLHVYHHATVPIMCYTSLQTSQSMFHGVVIINSLVHVLMYFYYLLRSLGIRPKWKKLVTDCQILQLFSSFGKVALVFYHHFCGCCGCSGIWAWYFDLVFIASLLAMFLDFRFKSYHMRTNLKQD